MEQQTDKLVKSLIKAKLDFDPIKRNTEAHRYKYAPMDVVLAATEPSLAKNGIFISQHLGGSGADVEVETIIMHESGQFLRSSISKPLAKVDAQTTGSMVTYLRRYSYLAVLGLAQEDDDGLATTRQEPTKSLSNIDLSPGGYVVTFGKWNGKPLSSIPSHELESYVNFIEDSAAKDSKKVTGPALEFCNAVDVYLGVS